MGSERKGLTEAVRWEWGDDPDTSAKACAACRRTAESWAEDEANGVAVRFHCEKDWCWKAAERGDPDPSRCAFPRPVATDDTQEILDLLRLCSSQRRETWGGIFGVDWDTVKMVALEKGIDTSCSWWGVASWWDVFRTAESEWCAAMNKPKPKVKGTE